MWRAKVKYFFFLFFLKEQVGGYMIIPDVVITGGRRRIPDGTVAQKPIAPHLDKWKNKK
jgi:hypothetical protein